MEMQDYQTHISIPKNAKEVFEKIADIPAWWRVAFSGSIKKQNDQFTVRMGGDSFFNFTVTGFNPGKSMVWLVTDCYMPWFDDKTEWTNTCLVFNLNEHNGVTDVNFTHQGLTPELTCYKDCKPGWTHWIRNSLYAYLTTGAGDFEQRKTPNYQSVNYTVSIDVDKTAKHVFACLTQDIDKYWPEAIEGVCSKLNDEFIFSTGEDHYSKNRVIAFMPGKKLTWLVIDSIRKTDGFSWNDSTMNFDLHPQGNKTRLSFTYDGAVLEDEVDRLQQLCDIVVNENILNLLKTSYNKK